MISFAMPFGAKLLIDHVMQDWGEVLPRIDVPTLVTGGEVSHMVPSPQEGIAAQIPGATLKIFPAEEGGARAFRSSRRRRTSPMYSGTS